MGVVFLKSAIHWPGTFRFRKTLIFKCLLKNIEAVLRAFDVYCWSRMNIIVLVDKTLERMGKS